MRCDKESLLLYAVTDRSWTKNDTLYHQVWGKHEDYIPELEKLLNDRKLLKQMDENVRHARKEMIDVSLDKAVEIMEERMTA